VNRLGVKWFETQSVSSSRKTSSLERLHISPDHVHLFLSAHPKHAPSEIVRTVKSITAREMWNSTNRFYRSICGVADFGRNRTTLGRQVMFRPTRLSSISSERNTF